MALLNARYRLALENQTYLDDHTPCMPAGFGLYMPWGDTYLIYLSSSRSRSDRWVTVQSIRVSSTSGWEQALSIRFIVRSLFLLSLRGTPSYCHCEAQSAEAISMNTRGLPRLQLAMTGKGDNDTVRKQRVTNHVNEYSPLTPPHFTCFYGILTKE